MNIENPLPAPENLFPSKLDPKSKSIVQKTLLFPLTFPNF